MAHGFATFSILLDDPDETFSPGEKITGDIFVELRRAKCLKGLQIKFKGEAEIKWIDSKDEDDNITWDQRYEDYFRSEFYLLGGAGNTNILEVEAGRHKFPFTVKLPRNIPSSFEHKDGYVRYTIKAVWERPWSSDYVTSRTVDVETPYDLNQIPQAMIGINDEKNHSFCCFPFCIPMGSLAYDISIPSSGFAPGEIVRATISMDNTSSSINVKAVQLKLNQYITFYGTKTRRDTRIAQQVNHLGPFDKRENELVVPMTISRLPPTSFPHCSLISIRYDLDVEIDVSGCHCNPGHRYPVYIGTKTPPDVQLVRTIPVIPQTHTFSAPSAPPISEDTRSTQEDPPPSYDKCVGTSRENLLPHKKN